MERFDSDGIINLDKYPYHQQRLMMGFVNCTREIMIGDPDENMVKAHRDIAELCIDSGLTTEICSIRDMMVKILEIDWDKI